MSRGRVPYPFRVAKFNANTLSVPVVRYTGGTLHTLAEIHRLAPFMRKCQSMPNPKGASVDRLAIYSEMFAALPSAAVAASGVTQQGELECNFQHT